MAEFGAVFVVLVCVIFIPLLSASFIPIRYAMAQGVITDLVNKLAHCEKRSDAYTMLNDPGWKKLLAACNTEEKETKLVLVATTTKGGNKELFVQQNDTVPQEWLPDGSNGPCSYALHLDCQCAISPLFGSNGGVTGFNAPVTLNVSSAAHWMNLARDPKSKTLSFYLEE